MSKTMTKIVKTYPRKYLEIWEEFRDFPGKILQFPGRKIPAANPIEDHWRLFLLMNAYLICLKVTKMHDIKQVPARLVHDW